MHELDDAFWKRASQFKSIVPVFTNVVFDTSQGHATWSSSTCSPGSTWCWKRSRRTRKFSLSACTSGRNPPGQGKPGDRFGLGGASAGGTASNVLFISPDQYVSSYDLIAHAKFVMVYNSTVGLEASVMDKPVLCAGKARYTKSQPCTFRNPWRNTAASWMNS
jgi:hypothetical protein